MISELCNLALAGVTIVAGFISLFAGRHGLMHRHERDRGED